MHLRVVDGHECSEDVRPMVMQIALAHDNLEGRVESQEGSYQRGFVPEEIRVEQGMVEGRCRHRQRDVVYVDDNTLAQSRHHLEKEKIDIAVFLADMA